MQGVPDLGPRVCLVAVVDVAIGCSKRETLVDAVGVEGFPGAADWTGNEGDRIGLN